MKTVLFYIGFLILGILLYSCRKYDLNQFETINYDVYNLGDTLIFKSLKDSVIKKYLVDNKSNKTFYDVSLVHVGNEREAYVHFKVLEPDNDSNIPYSRDGNFKVSVNSDGNSIFLYFNGFSGFYKNDFGKLNQFDTITFYNKKVINYYLLTDSTSYTVSIIWQEKYGIIKFDLKYGGSFVRINIPDLCN